MKVTLDIQQTFLIEELERLLARFHVPYQTKSKPLQGRNDRQE